jgi:hypothetical protein
MKQDEQDIQEVIRRLITVIMVTHAQRLNPIKFPREPVISRTESTGIQKNRRKDAALSVNDIRAQLQPRAMEMSILGHPFSEVFRDGAFILEHQLLPFFDEALSEKGYRVENAQRYIALLLSNEKLTVKNAIDALCTLHITPIATAA